MSNDDPSGATIADMTVCAAFALAFILANLTMVIVIIWQRAKAKAITGFLMYEQIKYHQDFQDLLWALVEGREYHWPTLIERTKLEWGEKGDGQNNIKSFDDLLAHNHTDLDTQLAA